MICTWNLFIVFEILNKTFEGFVSNYFFAAVFLQLTMQFTLKWTIWAPGL